ncbi:nucleoside 2-deoxyribosyltransferase [Pararhizobium sp.]|uniref:nucleoside 2-deoxyribosyltransferase n=1 Tax=Pararhizobium sp. TaxID=1977563 RepID=UPI003D0EB69D
MDVYTAGYMAGPGSNRPDWRHDLEHCLLPNLDNIRWLHPGVPPGEEPGAGSADMFFPRDILQIRHCDMMFAYLDLSIARCLGACGEIGFAYGLGIPIIMVDCSAGVRSLDFQRKMATAVFHTLEEGAEALRFSAMGMPL